MRLAPCPAALEPSVTAAARRCPPLIRVVIENARRLAGMVKTEAFTSASLRWSHRYGFLDWNSAAAMADADGFPRNSAAPGGAAMENSPCLEGPLIGIPENPDTHGAAQWY